MRARAAELIGQLSLDDAEDAAAGPSSTEMAATVMRTLRLPDIAALRPRLVPELPVHASAVEGSKISLTAGIADAVAFDGKGRIDVVVDWKSDVKPTRETGRHVSPADLRLSPRDGCPNRLDRLHEFRPCRQNRSERLIREASQAPPVASSPASWDNPGHARPSLAPCPVRRTPLVHRRLGLQAHAEARGLPPASPDLLLDGLSGPGPRPGRPGKGVPPASAHGAANSSIPPASGP